MTFSGYITQGVRRRGFTIVELLIVIVVIAILAAITVVAYGGIQNSTRNSRVMSEIRQVAQLVEAYNIQNGSYPSTGGISRVYTDTNCPASSDVDGYKGSQWVPGVGSVPQSPTESNKSILMNYLGGCYMYASDGDRYILSAWNEKMGNPSTGTMYRRIGWREGTFFGDNGYLCNHPNIGGYATGSYISGHDYYRYSYTISNITTCDETPPPGA